MDVWRARPDRGLFERALLCRNLQLAVDNDTNGRWAQLGEWMQQAAANASMGDLIRLLAMVYLQRGETPEFKDVLDALEHICFGTPMRSPRASSGT